MYKIYNIKYTEPNKRYWRPKYLIQNYNLYRAFCLFG